MPTTLARAPEPPTRAYRGIAAAVAVAIAALIAFFALSGLVHDPDVVDRVRIRNETSDLVEVLVRGDQSTDLTPIAIVEPDRSATAFDVVDQGERWTFVVRSSGETVTKLRVTRDELERADWAIEIPAEDQSAGAGG